jgi:molybdate transport system substrate-binding protein
VYETDALAEDAVKIIGTFPKATHRPIVYPVAMTVASEGESARAFFEYMISNDAKAIFERYVS